MRRLIPVLVALILGAAGGYLAAPSPECTEQTCPQAEVAVPEVAPPPAPRSAPTSAAPAPSPRSDPSAPAPPDTCRSCRRALAGVRGELREAQESLHELQDKASGERALRADTEGQPIPFPPDLPKPYRGDAMMAAFQDAIDAADADADIHSMDCSEFPCIVYGEVRSGAGMGEARAAFEAIYAQTGARYEGSGMYISKTEWPPEAGSGDDARLLFSATYYPKGMQDDSEGELGKRMRFRKNQYFDAVRADPE